jgi:hypothetical protein
MKTDRFVKVMLIMSSSLFRASLLFSNIKPSRILSAINILFCLFLVGCSNTSDDTNIASNSITQKTQNTGLDKNAEEYALTEINKLVTNCNGIYYMASSGLIELRNPQIIVESAKLGEADNLNKISWKGKVRLVSKITRGYDMSKYVWADWQDGERAVEVSISRKNEKWQTDFKPQAFALMCNEMPFNNVETLKQQDAEAQIFIEKAANAVFSKCGEYYVASLSGITPYKTKLLNFKVGRKKDFDSYYHNGYHGWIYRGSGEVKYSEKWTSENNSTTSDTLSKAKGGDWEANWGYQKTTCAVLNE